MRGSKARMLRKAAEYRPTRDRATYAPAELHHIAAMPQFETHVRTVREMGPAGKVIAREVVKIRYGKDGKTPLFPVIVRKKDPITDKITFEPQTELVPVAKPVRVAPGSPRRVYRTLKVLDRREGIENVFKRLKEEVA